MSFLHAYRKLLMYYNAGSLEELGMKVSGNFYNELKPFALKNGVNEDDYNKWIKNNSIHGAMFNEVEPNHFMSNLVPNYINSKSTPECEMLFETVELRLIDVYRAHIDASMLRTKVENCSIAAEEDFENLFDVNDELKDNFASWCYKQNIFEGKNKEEIFELLYHVSFAGKYSGVGYPTRETVMSSFFNYVTSVKTIETNDIFLIMCNSEYYCEPNKEDIIDPQCPSEIAPFFHTYYSMWGE